RAIWYWSGIIRRQDHRRSTRRTGWGKCSTWWWFDLLARIATKTARKSMKILVVEDDLALSDVTAFTLRRAGFAVAVAHNGEDAILQWQRELPSLVLLDLNLPKQDGIAVCKHIRAESNTPIIILSVRNSDESIVEALELGADDYIVKPFSTTQLVAR